MRRHYMDYTKSSTRALAKEAVCLHESHTALERVYSFLDNNSEDPVMKEHWDSVQSVVSHLIYTENEVLIVLFDRFVDEFGIREYWDAHPDHDWLDHKYFIKWYEALAEETTARESRDATNSMVQYWAERIEQEGADV